MVTHRYPLEDWWGALKTLARPEDSGVLKAAFARTEWGPAPTTRPSEGGTTHRVRRQPSAGGAQRLELLEPGVRRLRPTPGRDRSVAPPWTRHRRLRTTFQAGAAIRARKAARAPHLRTPPPCPPTARAGIGHGLHPRHAGTRPRWPRSARPKPASSMMRRMTEPLASWAALNTASGPWAMFSPCRLDRSRGSWNGVPFATEVGQPHRRRASQFWNKVPSRLQLPSTRSRLARQDAGESPSLLSSLNPISSPCWLRDPGFGTTFLSARSLRKPIGARPHYRSALLSRGPHSHVFRCGGLCRRPTA